jgi:hypothetical protein
MVPASGVSLATTRDVSPSYSYELSYELSFERSDARDSSDSQPGRPQANQTKTSPRQVAADRMRASHLVEVMAVLLQESASSNGALSFQVITPMDSKRARHVPFEWDRESVQDVFGCGSTERRTR